MIVFIPRTGACQEWKNTAFFPLYPNPGTSKKRIISTIYVKIRNKLGFLGFDRLKNLKYVLFIVPVTTIIAMHRIMYGRYHVWLGV